MEDYSEFDGNQMGRVMSSSERDIDMENFMSEHHRDYITYSTINIMCITFNVNTRSPRGEIINMFIPPNDFSKPDVYALSLQEMDLGTEALLRGSKITNREQEWLNAISMYLEPGYLRISRQRLLGIALFLYVAKDCRAHVRLKDERNLATGLMGIVGNKGGVSATISYMDTTITFVGSHFPAHEENVSERNQNFRDIGRVCVGSNDVIFWLGDLNYRLTNVGNEYVRQTISSDDFGSLTQFDQLNIEKESKRVFVEYFEPPIIFPPTYKFDPGSDDYDTSPKFRVPAWTDRILYYHSNNNPVEYLYYNSVSEVRFSDHKPVRAIFSVIVGSVDLEREKVIRGKFNMERTRIESRMQPKAELSQNEVNFGNVYFMEIAERIVELRNVGTSPLRFEIVNIFNGETSSALHSSWLSVEPRSHTVEAGKTELIYLSVHITMRDLEKFNHMEQMSDTLIVQVDRGSHHFLCVDACLRPTSFGRSLNLLCNSTRPFSQLDVVDLAESQTQEHELPVPKELYYLIDNLVQLYLKGEVDITSFSGSELLSSELSHIVRCIDGYCECCTPQSLVASSNSLFYSLLLFIGSLTRPLIKSSNITLFMNPSSPSPVKDVLDLLPYLDRCNVIYLMAFLRYISQNVVYEDKLEFATKIETSLFQTGECQNSEDENKRILFILSFLNMDDYVLTELCEAVHEF